MPVDIYGRDATLVQMSDTEPTVGRLFDGPAARQPVAARRRSRGM